jgi:hypothetical protein
MTTRGTTNGNRRGSSEARRRRREWLVATYRADVDGVRVLRVHTTKIETWFAHPGRHDDLVDQLLDNPFFDVLDKLVPACRCYRCGRLLTAADVTVDRIIPGCRGGTYRRTNIRPACGVCNSETGGSTRSGRR